MNYRFSELARKIAMSLCLAAVVGGFTACHDDYDLDDPGNYPSWLGQSIYDELKSPNADHLTGTFTNYLRLIDDLGYTETLQRTGSKTVFPANDEAFARFFASNDWGVSKYEDLSDAQKKLLLYNSMLDNAILVEMLSNVPDDNTSVTSGVAMKHQTGVNIIDTISHFYGASDLPRNNSYWEKYYKGGIDMVMDATRPMMVHFTAEQLTANNITTMGENSDFAVITGTPYDEDANTAYIFRNRIISPDVTCKNGYIHQMENLIVPPGNLAEMLRTSGESSIFSRMLDRFSAPFYNVNVTNNYNDWALVNGYAVKDSIFEKRYFSSRSQGGSSLSTDPDGKSLSTDQLLPYDPGWTQYYPDRATSTLSDMGAMFVPTDDAMKQYFLPGGSGAFLIEQFGSKPNNEENLLENIDSIPKNIVQAFVSMLMKPQFVSTVPSKFDNVMDDSQDPLGITLSDLNVTSDGKYDVKIANNGVAYMTNKVFAPNRYVAVSAPALLADNMRVMNWGIQDQSYLSLNYYAYLLAMDANYAFFIPTDRAFDLYYVDPVYLRRSPRVLHFYYRTDRSPYIFCSAFDYDPSTGTVGKDSTNVSISNFRSQFIDILNTHTVILESGETFGDNHYYKTKNGGGIKVSGNTVGSTVASGSQIDGININGTQGAVIDAAKITQVYNQKNGKSFALDHVIQMPMKSVYSTLASTEEFSEFYNLCSEDRIQLGLFAGISNKTTNTQPIAPIRQFTTFIDAGGYHGLDQDVSYFSGYNYTVYAPDNEAMKIAHDKYGLPTWDDVREVAAPWLDEETGEYETDDTEECKLAQAKVYAMIETISNFIRYHFQDNSVYADNKVTGGEYYTANTDTLGIAAKLRVLDGSNGEFKVRDARGNEVTVSANVGHKVNLMARDYVFNNTAVNATQLLSSSFAVVHEIASTLNPNTNTDRYDGLWGTAEAKRKLIGHQKLGLQRLARMYRK
jgi:uncharacterized surface protein with fasciclin (FAS1) repeats